MKATKKTIFKISHIIAKATVSEVGNYSIAFSLALKFANADFSAALKQSKAFRAALKQGDLFTQEQQKKEIKSMAINVQKITTGFRVFFPFDLKDSFKSTFKTAKWNPDARAWEVGVRSGKRLEQWIALADPVAKEILDSAEEELNAEELIKIEEEITTIRLCILEARTQNKKYATTDMLNAAKEQLKTALIELESERKKAAEEKAKALSLIEQVCDIAKIESAHNYMKQSHGKVGAKHRNIFNESCYALKAENDKLKAIGFCSVGMDELYYMNFNRPDRDNPYDIDMSDILNIVEYSG